MILTLVKKRLLHNKLNIFIIISSFVVCFFCTHTFFIVYGNLKSGFVKHSKLNDVIVGAASSDKNFIKSGLLLSNTNTTSLTQGYLNSNTIKFQAPIYLGESYKGNEVIATNQSFFKIISKKIGLNKINLNDDEVIIGYEVAKKLDYKLNKKIIITNHFHNHNHHESLILKQILPKTNTIIDNKLFITVGSLKKMHDHENKIFPQFIWASLKNPMLYFKLKQEIEPNFKVFSAKLNKKKFIKTFSSLFFVFKIILIAIVVLALMLIALYISNKFTQLKEEVNILKNFGASDNFIILSIFLEFAIIYILSFIISISLSYVHLINFKDLYENLIMFPLSNIFFSTSFYFLLFITPLLFMLSLSFIFSKFLKK